MTKGKWGKVSTRWGGDGWIGEVKVAQRKIKKKTVERKGQNLCQTANCA